MATIPNNLHLREKSSGENRTAGGIVTMSGVATILGMTIVGSMIGSAYSDFLSLAFAAAAASIAIAVGVFLPL